MKNRVLILLTSEKAKKSPTNRRFQQFASLRNIPFVEIEWRRGIELYEICNEYSLVFVPSLTYSGLTTDLLAFFESYAKKGLQFYIKGIENNNCIYGEFNIKNIAVSSSLQYHYSVNDNLHQPIRGITYTYYGHEFYVSIDNSIHRTIQNLGTAGNNGESYPWFFLIEHSHSGKIYYDLNEVSNSIIDFMPIVNSIGHPENNFREYPILAILDKVFSPERICVTKRYFNISIDDRPTENDWMMNNKVQQFLVHLASIYPRFHIDFAWIPKDQKVSTKQLEIFKRFPIGFVRHAFDEHFPHVIKMDYQKRMVLGNQLISQIENKYNVRFQNVFVFPVQCGIEETIKILKDNGYLCIVNKAEDPLKQGIEPFVYASKCFNRVYGILPILIRYLSSEWTKEFMLAHLVLGLPILVYGHAKDCGTARRNILEPLEKRVHYFDEILYFAKQNSIIGESLENIYKIYSVVDEKESG